MGTAFVSRQLAEAATVNSRYAVRIARSDLTVLIRTDQKYSFAPSCMRRGLLAWAVITPNVLLLLKSVPGAVAPVDVVVPGAAKITRLKILNASRRMSRLTCFESLVDLARLTFSDRFQKPLTSGFVRGALPSSPTGCTKAARFKNRSIAGSNSAPATGARQSWPVTLGRLTPLKMLSGDVPVVTAIGKPLL